MEENLSIGKRVWFFDDISSRWRSAIVVEFSEDRQRVKVSVHGKNSKQWLKIKDLEEK
jgi:hypothetical protein